MKDSKTKDEESTRLTYTGFRHSYCHTYLETSVSERQAASDRLCSENRCTCVSFTEVGSVCRVALREPIHLCTCVSEEGGDGEAARSETTSLLSYTFRYVSFTEAGSRTDVPVYMRERGGQGQGGSGGGWGHIKCTIVNRSCRIRRVCNFCEHERGSEGRGSKKNDTEKYKVSSVTVSANL